MDIKHRSNCSYCNSNRLDFLSYESTLKTIPAGLTRGNTEIFKGLRCRNCSTFFKKNTEDLSYEEDYSKSKTYNSEHVLKEKLDEYPYSLEILNFLDLKPNSKILEIGAGSGWLSRYLISNGHEDVLAIEKDEHYLSLIKESGVKASSEIPDSKFDVIIFVGLYEHLEDPIKFVHSLFSNHLEDMGQVFFQFPNPKSITALINPSGWDMLFEPGHIDMPSAKGLEKAFQNMKIEYRSSTITTRGRIPWLPMRIDSIEKKWLKATSNFKLLGRINKLLFQAQDIFNLGETLNVVLKK